MTDPLDPTLERMLGTFRRAAASLPPPRVRSIKKTSLLAALLAALIVSTAIAGTIVLGAPAPSDVKRNLTKADAVFLAAGVHVNKAKAVAVDGKAILYGALANDGAYCTALIVPPTPQSRVHCESGVSPDNLTVEGRQQVVSLQHPAQPYVLSGHLSTRGTRLLAKYPDGTLEDVRIGLDGFFVFRPDAAGQARVREGGVTLIERTSAGLVVNETRVLPPISISTSGTPVRTMSGQVSIKGARLIDVIVYSRRGKLARENGSDQIIQIDRAGRFKWSAPKTAGSHYVITLDILTSSFEHLVDDVSVG